jgi:hypothetical protein
VVNGAEFLVNWMFGGGDFSWFENFWSPNTWFLLLMAEVL